MEVQLRELIDQIKRDGVATAEEEAKAIINAAQANAEKIVADVQAKAEKILSDAENETERMTKSSEDAIRQACRNILISFRESVSEELKTIIGDKVSAVYSSDALVKIIADAVGAFAKNPDVEDISVILNAEDLNRLEENALAALKEKMLKGVTLRANDNFDGGFRIAVNNGSAYYDYSEEAVVDMLSNYLSPKVTELLKEA